MKPFELSLTGSAGQGLTAEQLRLFLRQVMDYSAPGDALLLPPDLTRLHSGGGLLARELYGMLKQRKPEAAVNVMPALGTHEPLTRNECLRFFGGEIPESAYLVHDWREGVERIGEVPREFVRTVSDGLMDEAIPVDVSRELSDSRYAAIFSIGQVVPHEVAGMANYSKNILVGVGGGGIINLGHMLGAVYGMERIVGRMDNPVRAVFDYAQEHFLNRLPVIYILTVTTASETGAVIHGVYAGNTRACFEKACELAKQKNLTFVEQPIQKVVVYLDPDEFRTTWVGNKAIYRTRMAIADGGQLLILAPGVRRFGEDSGNDRLIRKYGYTGRENILRLFGEQEELRQNQGVAAHLIHGSADGRFSVTYATGLLTQQEVESVGYAYMPYREAATRYNPEKMREGYNLLPDGEQIFFIGNPALGLWSIPF